MERKRNTTLFKGLVQATQLQGGCLQRRQFFLAEDKNGLAPHI
jgi:hypothetical protein